MGVLSVFKPEDNYIRTTSWSSAVYNHLMTRWRERQTDRGELRA